MIEQKGMTFDHDFGYHFHLFSSLLKKVKKKRRMNSKYRDQNLYLSARSNNILEPYFSNIIFLKGIFKRVLAFTLPKNHK